MSDQPFFTKTVTCPRCRKDIEVSAYLTLWQCHCGQWFDYNDLIPFRNSGLDCLENSKLRRNPDWIEQWEQVERKYHKP